MTKIGREVALKKIYSTHHQDSKGLISILNSSYIKSF